MGFELAKHVFRPGEGEVLVMPPPISGQIILLVDPQNTGETKFSTLIQTLEPGAAVPVHRHQKAEQVLFFFSGSGTAVIEGQATQVNPGTTVHVPRNSWHGYSNTGNEPLCVLETTSPPGFENNFRELSRLSASGPIDPETLATIAAKHDIWIATDGAE